MHTLERVRVGEEGPIPARLRMPAKYFDTIPVGAISYPLEGIAGRTPAVHNLSNPATAGVIGERDRRPRVHGHQRELVIYVPLVGPSRLHAGHVAVEIVRVRLPVRSSGDRRRVCRVAVRIRHVALVDDVAGGIVRIALGHRALGGAECSRRQDETAEGVVLVVPRGRAEHTPSSRTSRRDSRLS